MLQTLEISNEPRFARSNKRGAGALTFLPQPFLGEWTHEGSRYEDANLRIVVDVEDTEASAQFFADLKQTLKERFRQIDIWIASCEICIT